jgi:hypothetical protein
MSEHLRRLGGEVLSGLAELGCADRRSDTVPVPECAPGEERDLGTITLQPEARRFARSRRSGFPA